MPLSSFSQVDGLASSIALIAGIWGALLSFIKRNTAGFSIAKKLILFVMDMFVNVGITMLIYIGCIGYGLNDLMSVAIAGFLGHQGTRSIYLIELIILEKMGAKDTFNEMKKDRDAKPKH